MNRSYKFLKRMVLICGIMILCVTILYHIPLWPFRPVFFVCSVNGEKQLKAMTFSLNPSEADSLCAVLKDNNEIHVRIDNVIFVSGCLFFDDEMRWNHTSKAGIKCRDKKYGITHSCDGGPMLLMEKKR